MRSRQMSENEKTSNRLDTSISMESISSRSDSGINSSNDDHFDEIILHAGDTKPDDAGNNVSRPLKKLPSVENFAVSEGGWGWVCVAALSVVSLLTRGTTSSFSLIYQQLRLKFHSTAAETGWAYCTYAMTSMCLSPVIAALCRRYTPRKVAFCGAILHSLGITLSGFTTSLSMAYITFFIAGVGSVCVSMPGLMIINYYFSKKRSRAMAIALITNGLGGAIYAPFVSYLFEHYGYTGTMMIIGGLLLHILAAALVYVVPKRFRGNHGPKPAKDVNNTPGIDSNDVKRNKESQVNASQGKLEENTKETVIVKNVNDMQTIQEFCEKDVECDKSNINKNHLTEIARSKRKGLKKHINIDVLRRRSFALYCLMMCTYSVAMSMNSVVVADFFAGRKLARYEIAALLSMYDIVSIPTRTIIGFTCDTSRLRNIRVIIYGCTILSIGFFLILGPLTTDIVTTFIWYGLFGIFSAMSSTQELVVIADILGAKYFPDGVGLSKFFRGLGVMLGPTLGGMLADRTGSYNNTYRCAGVWLMVTSIIFLTNIILEKRKETKSRKANHEINKKPVC